MLKKFISYFIILFLAFFMSLLSSMAQSVDSITFQAQTNKILADEHYDDLDKFVSDNLLVSDACDQTKRLRVINSIIVKLVTSKDTNAANTIFLIDRFAQHCLDLISKKQNIDPDLDRELVHLYELSADLKTKTGDLKKAEEFLIQILSLKSVLTKNEQALYHQKLSKVYRQLGRGILADEESKVANNLWESSCTSKMHVLPALGEILKLDTKK